MDPTSSSSSSSLIPPLKTLEAPEDLHDPVPEDHHSEDSAAAAANLPFSSISLSLSLSPPFSILKSKSKSSPPNLSAFTSHLKIPSQISALSLSTAPTPTRPARPRPRPNNHSFTPLQAPSLFPRRRPSDPPAGAAGGRRVSLLWFRCDLRLHDNEALTAASSDSLSLLPVFLFDPRDFGRSPSGFDRTGPYRARFLLDSVADLRESLRARGSDLVVRVGRPETVLPELARAVSAEAVYAHREVSADEVRTEEKVEKAMQEEGIEVKYFWGSTLYHIDDLPFGLDKMPSNYGGFRDKVKSLAVRKALEATEDIKGLPTEGDVEVREIPSLKDLGLNPPSVDQECKSAVNSSLKGGETVAMDRLKKFAAECRAQPKPEGMNGARDSIYGANFSCKISPWLATGCLSPRYMFEELRKTATRTISASTQKKGGDATDTGMNWLMFELLWRDFFRFITKKYSSNKRKTEAVPATACSGALA